MSSASQPICGVPLAAATHLLSQPTSPSSCTLGFCELKELGWDGNHLAQVESTLLWMEPSSIVPWEASLSRLEDGWKYLPYLPGPASQMGLVLKTPLCLWFVCLFWVYTIIRKSLVLAGNFKRTKQNKETAPPQLIAAHRDLSKLLFPMGAEELHSK